MRHNDYDKFRIQLHKYQKWLNIYLYNALWKSIYSFMPELQFNLASHRLGRCKKCPLSPYGPVLLICHYVVCGRKSMALPLNNHHMKTREIYHGETISNWNTWDAWCKRGNLLCVSYVWQRRSWWIMLSFAESGFSGDPDLACCCWEGFLLTRRLLQ